MSKQNQLKKIEEIIRVDHAGEYGAKVIYAGQIAALKLKKDHQTLALVEEMKKQEDVHFAYFDEQIKKQKIRPTLMQPLWHLGGFALGFLTALVDKRAAMACTTAVEEVIDEHYREQLDSLSSCHSEQPFCHPERSERSRDVGRDPSASPQDDNSLGASPQDDNSLGASPQDDNSLGTSPQDDSHLELQTKIEKFRAEELEHRDIGYEHHAADLKYFKPLTAFIKATTKFAIAVSKKI